MKRNNKKGFTIVELTIVIAVIAILAAVLIPTFSSVVDKANQSADIQLIRQANVVLQAATADGSSLTEDQAKQELKNNSITLGKPSQSDHAFLYINEEKRYVIYNMKTEKITFPEDLAQNLSTWKPDSYARIGTTYYETLEKAVNGAKDGETIVVLNDITTDEQLFIDKSITIDFGGHSYIMKNFKYQDSDDHPGGIVIGNNVRVQNGTFKNGTIKLIGNASIEGYAFWVENCQKFTVVGITLDLTESGTMRGGLGISNNSTVIVEDCTFEGVTKQGYKKCAIYLDNWKGGSFKEGECVSLTVKGNSAIKGKITENCHSNSYVKTVLENSVDCSSTSVAFTGCLPKGWKIKTPDGKKLSGMENFSDEVDNEGYFTYPKS